MGEGGKRRASAPRAMVAVAGLAVVVAVAVVAFVIGHDSAGIWFGSRDGAEIYERQLTRAGWPELSGIYSPDGGLAKPVWRLCDPDCGEVISRDEVLQPGSTPPGSKFQLETTYRGKTTTDRSPTWRGRVTNVSPPTFSGAAAVGVTLKPQAGKWRGGWDDDRSQVGMQACRTPTGGDCRAMTEASFRSSRSGDAVVNVGYAGWYVGAIETRTSGQPSETLEAYGFPPDQVSTLSAPKTGQIVAAGPLCGPVQAAAEATLPNVEFRASASVDARDPITVATLRCPLQCGVEVLVRRDGRHFGLYRGTVAGSQDIKIRPARNVRTTGPLEVSVNFAAFKIRRNAEITVQR